MDEASQQYLRNDGLLQSSPHYQFDKQVQREVERLFHQREPLLRNNGRIQTLPFDETLDYKANAENNVRARRVEQGIWKDKWGMEWPEGSIFRVEFKKMMKDIERDKRRDGGHWGPGGCWGPEAKQRRAQRDEWYRARAKKTFSRLVRQMLTANIPRRQMKEYMRQTVSEMVGNWVVSGEMYGALAGRKVCNRINEAPTFIRIITGAMRKTPYSLRRGRYLA